MAFQTLSTTLTVPVGKTFPQAYYYVQKLSKIRLWIVKKIRILSTELMARILD